MQDQIPGSGTHLQSLTRLVLSGDHPLIRTALGGLIAAEGVVVAGECPNQPPALRRAVAAGADLVIMDLDLDAGWSMHLERLEHLLAAASGCPLLIVTRSAEPKAIATIMQKGAVGVVLKSSPADVLKNAMRAVLTGGAWIDPSAMATMFRRASDENMVDADRLTRREGQIVELVTLGLQNKKIAERLSITETTVRHHLTSIFEKLAVTNRMELMRYAYGDGGRPENSDRA
jgi:DNA-binding NarL/FixJ family response regulator